MVKSDITLYNTLYNRWKHMKERCNNPKRKDYKCYGGKGVSVCPKWNLSFENFKSWFDKSYSRYIEDSGYVHPSDLAVDRIDSSGPYSPSNCRLITRSENISISNRERSAKRRAAQNEGVAMPKYKGKRR